MTGPISLGAIGDQYIRALVYGGSGIGKTIFANTSQTMPTFMFDIDDGRTSARAYCIKHNLNPDWTHVWPVTCAQDFFAGFEWFTRNIHQYRLVTVDTATELQQMLLEESRVSSNLPIASKREWGIVFTAMESIMRNFRHLPVHVLWVAHEAEKDDEYFHRMMYRPSFQGAFATHHAKHFSEIWRYCLFEQQVRVEGPEQKIDTVTHRLLQCNRDQFSQAKDRSMSLDQFEPPQIDVLFHKMLTGITTRGIDISTEEKGEN